MSLFDKKFTFISTGDKKGFYTLRVYGHNRTNGKNASAFIRNLSTDKDRAITKARLLSEELGLPLNEEIDFELNEIARNESLSLHQPPIEAFEDAPITEDHSNPSQHISTEGLDGQDLAIAMILNGDNVFVTGPGGCGKSWVVKEVYNPKNTILCAPTGIAAINIGGVTCHRLFGLPMGCATAKDKRTISSSMKTLFSDNKIKRIIIDEAGMLRTDHLDLIDHKLKQVKKNNLPFGGIQVVAVGDFFQLSPIVSNQEKEVFYSEYQSPFCFTSKNWNFKTVVLEKVYRQEALQEVAVLNSIRKKDKHHKRAINWIMDKAEHNISTEATTYLCTTRDRAENHNKFWYDKLKTKERLYYGTSRGGGEWGNDVPAPKHLYLKEGAKVLLCANDPNGQFKNGQTGVVIKAGISDVIVKLDNSGEQVIVAPFTWDQYKYVNTEEGIDRVVDKSFTQLPIKLGWAITVHASQGMTLEDVCVEVGRGCFAHGQLYVALSRIKCLSKINIGTPLREQDVIVHQEVVDFYEQLRADE